MSEVLFYHLERQKTEQVLPVLLDKTLQRGWRAVVQARSGEMLKPLSESLWTWRATEIANVRVALVIYTIKQVFVPVKLKHKRTTDISVARRWFSSVCTASVH